MNMEVNIYQYTHTHILDALHIVNYTRGCGADMMQTQACGAVRRQSYERAAALTHHLAHLHTSYATTLHNLLFVTFSDTLLLVHADDVKL